MLQSAGFLFFAFACYARIATLGEEARDPAITIPRAVPRALAAVLVVYLVVGVTALAVVPASALAATSAPLRVVIEAGRLNALAMARQRELPHWLAHVHITRSLPLRAELTVAAVVIALVVVLDLRSAIGISGVAVLTYYAITNAAALTLRPEQRRWPALVAVVGLLGCVTLVAALPPAAILTGVITLAVGALVRFATRPTRR